MLDTLILADLSAEHYPILGILRRELKHGAAHADLLGGDENALGVHAVEYVAQTLALLSNQRVFRHRQVVNEEFVGVDRSTAQLVDLPNVDVVAVELRVEEAKPFAVLLDLLDRRGAREDEHMVGDLRGGYPDFLARDQVIAIRLL